MARAKNWRVERVYGTVAGSRFAAVTHLPTGKRFDVLIRGARDGSFPNAWGDPYPFEETRRAKIYEMADKKYSRGEFRNPRRKRSARVNGARKATRRRNAPVKHGARETFELAYYQGYAIEVAYRRELDGKLYSHKVETDAAEVYLAKHPVFGHCVIILDPSGKTPLWK